jgi:hypothetical protein
MKLKVTRVIRDKDGKVVTREPVDIIPVFRDVAKTESEVANLDAIQIIGIAVNFIDCFFHANFRIGAQNSRGRFTAAAEYPPALWSISKAQTPNLWETLIEGKTSFDLDEVAAWLHAHGAVSRAGRDLWNLPDVETDLIGAQAPKTKAATKASAKPKARKGKK